MIRVLFKRTYLLLAVMFIICISIHAHRTGNRSDVRLLTKRDIFRTGMIGSYPFIWFLLTANHTAEHPRLAYRLLGITLFSGGIILINLITICMRNKTDLHGNLL